MAVTTPELLQPDGLTITISQVPGVSPTRETGQGGKEVSAHISPDVGGHLLLFLCFSHLQFRAPLQLPLPCSPGCCCPPTPKEPQLKGLKMEASSYPFPAPQPCTYASKHRLLLNPKAQGSEKWG